MEVQIPAKLLSLLGDSGPLNHSFCGVCHTTQVAAVIPIHLGGPWTPPGPLSYTTEHVAKLYGQFLLSVHYFIILEAWHARLSSVVLVIMLTVNTNHFLFS